MKKEGNVLDNLSIATFWKKSSSLTVNVTLATDASEKNMNNIDLKLLKIKLVKMQRNTSDKIDQSQVNTKAFNIR